MWQWSQSLGSSSVGHKPAGDRNGYGNECQQRRYDQGYDQTNHRYANILNTLSSRFDCGGKMKYMVNTTSLIK